MEIDSVCGDSFEFNSPCLGDSAGKIENVEEDERIIIDDSEETPLGRSSIDGNAPPKTHPEEQVYGGNLNSGTTTKSIIIPDKSYNLPSLDEQLSQVTGADSMSQRNLDGTYAEEPTEEEEEPPKMLSPKQESVLIKKELLENINDEDSMETDPFLHPNLELPMDVDEDDEKDMKPIVFPQTTDEASELSFVPSDIPEDHQQPFLVDSMTSENGLMDSSGELESSSQQPGSPSIKVDMKKMENLEKVAAGLLASAA
ncbi:unnamed protein product, partial [Allacma fusca]